MESKSAKKNVHQYKSKRTQLKRQVNFINLTSVLQIESPVRSDENKASHPQSIPEKNITMKKKCWICNKHFDSPKVTQNSSSHSQEKTIPRQTIGGRPQLKKKMRDASAEPVLQEFVRDTSTKKHTEVKPKHKVFTSRITPYNVFRMSQLISCLAEQQIEKDSPIKSNLKNNAIAATSDPQVEDEVTNDTSASTSDAKTKVTQICDESDKLEIVITSDDKDISDVPSQLYLQPMKEQETVDNTDDSEVIIQEHNESDRVTENVTATEYNKDLENGPVPSHSCLEPAKKQNEKRNEAETSESNKNQQNDKSNKKTKKHSDNALTINKALKGKTTQENDKSSKAPKVVASNPGTSIPPQATTSKDKVKPKKFESAWLLGPKIIGLPAHLRNSPYLQSVMPKRNGPKKF